MNKKFTGKKLIILILTVLVVLGLGFSVYLSRALKTAELPAASETDDENGDEFDEYSELKELYASRKSMNADYIGEIYFESGIISEPFVQGETNDTYLRKNYEDGSYSEMGTVFLDYRNYLDDQNLIIYGHYIYSSLDPSGKNMFTPLSQLTEEENYEKNRHISLLLEDEIRRYEIVSVYYCELSYDESVIKNNLNYYYLGFDDEFFGDYKSSILEHEFYNTGVDFSNDDNYLTLQTCVENHDELREIVLAKEIERISISK